MAPLSAFCEGRIAMSEKPERQLSELEEELRAEKELNARMHRWFGTSAAVLGLVAIIVALSRMRAMFGISPLEALGIGSTTLPWLLLIVAIGVAFSMGTTRLLAGAEWIIKKLTGKKAG